MARQLIKLSQVFAHMEWTQGGESRSSEMGRIFIELLRLEKTTEII